MKKKGFCLKRAVSLLLAAAMIVTAAPQTSLTALAAEPGVTLENPDVSEGLEVMTVEDGTGVDGDIGDNGAGVPSDDGNGNGGVTGGEQSADPDDADQSENVGEGTEDPADPDDTNQGGDVTEDNDAEQPDEDASDSDETTEPEEDVDDDLTEDDETKVEIEEDEKFLNAAPMVLNEDSYTGEISQEGDRQILTIVDNQISKGSTVTDILKYYVAEENRFDEVRLNFNVTSSMNESQKIEAEYVNAAIEILKEGGSINYGINSEQAAGVSYNLQQPKMMEKDYNITFTAEMKPYQGVLVSLSGIGFPAESTYVSYMFRDSDANTVAECFWEPEEQDEESGYSSHRAAIFAWDNGAPTGAMSISENGIDFTDQRSKNFFQIGFSLNEAIYSQSGVAFEPGKKYLFASVHDAEDLSVSDEGRQVTAGTRAGSDENISDVTWKAFKEDIIEITDQNSATATLKALAVGTTFYYVTYKVADKTYSEIYKIATNQKVNGKELYYVGDFSVGSDDRGPFTMLRISEQEAKSSGNKTEEGGDFIADILEYHQSQGIRYNCVEIVEDVEDLSQTRLKQTCINGACGILEDSDGGDRYWLNYGFQKDEDGSITRISYNLWNPTECSADINVNLTMTLIPYQGVQVNLSETDFPCAGASFTYRTEETGTRDKGNFSACLEDEGAEFAMFSWNRTDGKLTNRIDADGIWFHEDQYYGGEGQVYTADFGVSISGEMKDQDCIITPLYRDEKGVPLNGMKEVEFGTRLESSSYAVGNIVDSKFGTLDDSIIHIGNVSGVKAQLEASNEPGETYYYATYDALENVRIQVLEVHYVRAVVATSAGVELSYLGEIREETNEEVPYRRLVIDEWQSNEKNAGATIADILTYYAEQIEAGSCEKFNCVELDMAGISTPMRRDDIGGAVSVMDTENEQIGYWIDYNYWLDDVQMSVGYTLSSPYVPDGDINAAVEAKLVPHKGVKIKAATTEFPAEYASMRVGKNEKNAFAECFEGVIGIEPENPEESENPEDLDRVRLLSLENGVPTSVTVPDGVRLDYYNWFDEGIKQTIYGSNLNMDIRGLKAGQEYLVTLLYPDEEVLPMRETKEITAGARIGSPNGIENVTWTPLEGMLDITSGEGAAATLTAKGLGEAYYCAEYKVGENEYLELRSIETVPGGSLAYMGEIIREQLDDGTPYVRLRIESWRAEEMNPNSDILDILKEYEEYGQKFNCVQLDMGDESLGKTVGAFDITIKKEYINGALNVMDGDNKEVSPWIDYNIGYGDDETKTWTGVSLSMNTPSETKTDVKVGFKTTEHKNQGLEVQFTTNSFPAEYVSMSYNYTGRNHLYTGSISKDPRVIRLFEHKNGIPTVMVSTAQEQCWGYYDCGKDDDDSNSEWTSLSFNNIKPLGTKKYLAAALYEDEERPTVGVPTQLQAGTRAGVDSTKLSSVTWKSFDTSKAEIDTDGKMTAWSTDDAIYYSVQYKYNNEQYLEVHDTYAQPYPVSIEFDEKEVTLKYTEDDEGSRRWWPQLRYYPGNADSNEDRIRWETVPSEQDIISFINEEYDGKIHGGIRAEGEGTVTVRANYLDGEYGDDGFVPTYPEVIIDSAEYTVTVVRQFSWNEMQGTVDNLNRTLFAVAGVDTKLSDVEFPEQYPGWAWKDPETSLADYQGMDGGSFASVYTDEYGHTFECRLYVRFVTPTIILTTKNNDYDPESQDPEWFEGVPESIKIGDNATLSYRFQVDNIDRQGEADAYNRIIGKLNNKYSDKIEWTTSRVGAGKVNEDKTFTFTADSSKAPEKQTVTVSVKESGTVLLKDTRTIIVTNKYPYDMDAIEYVTYEEKGDQLWLKIKVWMPEADTNQLTIVSEDTTIMKLNLKQKVLEPTSEVRGGGAGDSQDVTYVSIPFTQPKLKVGTAWIKITAPDEIKSTRRYSVEFHDTVPKVVSGTTISLNKQETNPATTVTVRTHYDYTITDTPTLLLDNKAATGLIRIAMEGPTVDSRADVEDIDYNNYNYYNFYDITLAMTADGKTNIKKGKHTVTLDFDMQIKEPGQEESGEPEHHQLKLTLNVTDTVPKVTFKQTKKYNYFYKDEEAYGILTVDTNGAEIDGEVKLRDPNNNGTCNYRLEQIPVFNEDGREMEDEDGNTVYETNVYQIILKKDNDGKDLDYTKNKKGVLTYKLKGFSEEQERTANFTVAAENKKPTIVLPAKSTTLYPKAGYIDTWMWMYNKTAGEGIDTDGLEVQYQAKGKDPIDVKVVEVKDGDDWQGSENAALIEGNNNFGLMVNTDGNIVTWLKGDSQSYKNKTDKFNLTIKQNNWRNPVAVSYSIKVDTAMPKLVLGKSTLTLNNNSDVYKGQQVRTTLRLKGCANGVYQDGWNWVSFTGLDENSRNAYARDGALRLDYWSNYGEVIVRINRSDLKTGTYKYKVSVNNGEYGEYASTTLTIKVVDKPVSKCLKVTAKGSINLMDRDDAYITYTPKISNLAGEVVYGRLVGDDADLFNAEWDEETGKLVVRAHHYQTYSTKMTYQVQAVFEVEAPDYPRYEVRTDAAKPLKIKVKQGKPKLKATMKNNTIYRQLDSSVQIELSAVFNKKPVEIEHVELLNYDHDFNLEHAERIRWDGSTYESAYDPQTGSVRLMLNDRYYAESVVKNGKTWKVKLKVVYREKAGNEKAAEVTCPIIVR